MHSKCDAPKQHRVRGSYVSQERQRLYQPSGDKKRTLILPGAKDATAAVDRRPPRQRVKVARSRPPPAMTTHRMSAWHSRSSR